MMNSEKKYKHCIKQLDTLDKFTSFMEDILIVNTLHLTDQELWGLIQQISKDVVNTNPVTIPSTSIQQWMEDYYNNWENMKTKDVSPESSNDSITSVDSSSSSKSSSYPSDTDSNDTLLLSTESQSLSSSSNSSVNNDYYSESE